MSEPRDDISATGNSEQDWEIFDVLCNEVSFSDLCNNFCFANIVM